MNGGETLFQHLAVGISTAFLVFVCYSIFIGKINKNEMEEINKVLADKGKQPMNATKGKLFLRTSVSIGAGIGAGLMSLVISLLF
jgi:hypothetical protein